jgi:transcriptional regulator with XRE-family HTH domain
VIKNERQYKVMLALAGKFRADIQRVKSEGEPDAFQEAEKAALVMHYREIMDELSEYEALRAGDRSAFEVRAFEELPQTLIKARIASGLTQRDLANKLGLSEQQVQRYEATEYASASLSRVLEVARVLGLRLDSWAEVEPSRLTLARELRGNGLTEAFVRTKLGIEALDLDDHSESVRLGTYRTLNRVFGCPADSFSMARSPEARTDARDVAFKRSKTALVLRPYVAYTRYLSVLLLRATDAQIGAIPRDPAAVVSSISSSYGRLGYEEALKYVWDLGIPVLPLADSGVFHGACWRIGGRNVIVLKQRTKSLSRWLFDLMHELRHASVEPQQDERSVVEDGDPILCRKTEREEFEANRFAGEVALCGRAEQLAGLCVERARGSVERLKSAVADIACEQGVDVGSLANYLAFRLSLQGVNWWGTAANLQPDDSPCAVTRDELLNRVDLGRLDATDRDLLERALEFEEEG